MSQLSTQSALIDPDAATSDAPGRDRRAAALQGGMSAFIFAAIFIGYGLWLGDRFLNVEARLLDVHQSVPVLFLALAVLVTLVCGLFDLSVASTATLSMFLTIGLTVNQGWPLALALLACIVLGALVGLANAVLVEVLHVNTFIATLGTGSIVGGLGLVYSGGSAIVPLPDQPLPAWFLAYGAYSNGPPPIVIALLGAVAIVGAFVALDWVRPRRLEKRAWWVVKALAITVVATLGTAFLDAGEWAARLPWSVTALVLVAICVWVLLDLTVFGRNLYAIGSNREAARLAGVQPSLQILKAFVLGGVLAALAGITFAASAGSASSDTGAAYLLPAFSAAFLSTVVFSRGRFTVLGTVLGGIFVVWTSIGLVIGGLPNTWTNVVNGFVLLFAVAFATYARRRSS